MTNDSRNAIVVRSTIELAHNLGLRTVAEGIEDAFTFERLRANPFWGVIEAKVVQAER